MKLFAISVRLARPAVLLAFLAASALPSIAKEDSLNYLAPGQPDSAAILAPPPLAGSAEQAADMAEVVAVFKACTTNETATAFSERKFSVFNFAPAVGSGFQPGKFPVTEAFFKRVQSDAAAATDTAKEYWKRPRPYVVDPSLASGKLEKSFSYPSGHSTESMVLALVLADLFPDRSEGIFAIARNIGWHRVEIARHYLTDIYAGRVFARAIVREMKSNAAFQKDLAAAKRELAGTTQAAAAESAVPHPAAAN
jgi:acid phosphatase (class A)